MLRAFCFRDLLHRRHDWAGLRRNRALNYVSYQRFGYKACGRLGKFMKFMAVDSSALKKRGKRFRL
jgi:hypothetical protein